jgi:RHS repeat-associated protein
LLADVRLSAIFADGFESGDTSAWSSQLPFASTLAGVARDTDVLGGGQARVWRYYDTDGVGSVRVITDEGGDVVERHDYLPFGEECTTGACETNPQGGGGDDRKFTGKERDTETGLDYFGARYYAASTARFTSVDPATTFQANLTDPQRWNRYAYARNNPLTFVDPDGRVIETAWDVFNIGLGVASLGYNLAEGNWGSAAFDAGGLVLDGVAAAVPFVPGGAGAAIKAGRIADKTVDAARVLDAAADGTRAARGGLPSAWQARKVWQPSARHAEEGLPIGPRTSGSASWASGSRATYQLVGLHGRKTRRRRALRSNTDR